MDTLSQILQAVHARSPLIADVRLGADVSVGLPALGGLPFHYIVKGACRLRAGSENVALAAGDFVMLARLPYYRFETGSGAHRVEVMDFAERDNFLPDELRTGRNQLLMRQIGDAPVQTRIISAILMPGGRDGGPLTRDLPVVTLLRGMTALLEPWLIAAIDFMSAEVRAFEPGFSAIAERLVEVIFIAVLRKWLLDGGHQRGWIRGLTDPAIARVLNAIHDDPGRRWTLRELAVASGRSRSSIAKHFHEVMGEPPFVYLTRWRMDLAASELAHGRRSIGEISAGLGYQAPQAFTRAFLTAFGETPAQYRRRRRTEQSATPPPPEPRSHEYPVSSDHGVP